MVWFHITIFLNSSRFDFSASLGATSKVGKDEIRDYNQKQYCQQFS